MPRRWLQFRLRTYYAVMLVAGIVFSIAGMPLREYQAEQRLLAKLALRKPPVPVWYEGDFEKTQECVRNYSPMHADLRTCAPVWLEGPVEWLGLSIFERVVHLHLTGTRYRDVELDSLGELKHLQSLILRNPQVSAEGLARLRAARPELEISIWPLSQVASGSKEPESVRH